MAHGLTSPADRARIEARIDTWLADQVGPDSPVTAVEKETEPASTDCRWYVRMRGEQKDVFTIWFTLSQRSLHYETYVMPAPEERAGELYEHLLRRNRKLAGLRFAIGDEDAVFLVGEAPLELIDDDELDRLIGTVYEAVERCFRPAMRIGYASRFRG